MYICDSFDKEKKYKKICKSKETNHQINESINNQFNNYHNCSFKYINFSHSKSKKIKNIINKKSLKNLFQYFSSDSKKKSNLTILELSEEKKNYHNNNTIEKIISKTRNNKTISVQKKNFKLKISNIEKEIEQEKKKENIKTNETNKIDKNNISKSQNKILNISKIQNKAINESKSQKKNNGSNCLNKNINKSNSPIKKK